MLLYGEDECQCRQRLLSSGERVESEHLPVPGLGVDQQSAGEGILLVLQRHERLSSSGEFCEYLLEVGVDTVVDLHEQSLLLLSEIVRELVQVLDLGVDPLHVRCQCVESLLPLVVILDGTEVHVSEVGDGVLA